jgi:hypothetical protein
MTYGMIHFDESLSGVKMYAPLKYELSFDDTRLFDFVFESLIEYLISSNYIGCDDKMYSYLT